MEELVVDQLTRALVERRCALFVGPDLGESVAGYTGLPNSWQLAAELRQECGFTGRLQPLPMMAQIYVRLRDRMQLVRYMQRRLGAPHYRPLPVHELIAHIPFPVIVSGGWDRLLEQALEQRQVPFRTVRLNTDLPFIDPSRQELLLYKPYGSIAEPDRLRITEDDKLDVFYDIDRVMNDLMTVVERYTLILVGYRLMQDSVFARIYHNIRRLQARVQPPAFAIHTQTQPEDSVVWDALGIRTISVNDPSEFLYTLAERVAAEEGRVLSLPPLNQISHAPRLTTGDLTTQALVLDSMLDQLGVADLIERTEIPLLSDDQVRDIESMRAAYERLTKTLQALPDTARIWLRQGNLEYARGNYVQAEQYYLRAYQQDKRIPEVYHNMHFVRLARGDWAGAMKFYRLAIRLQPDLTILPERYQLQDIIGSSDLSVVYVAGDLQTNGRVAIKVMHRGRANAERALALIQREGDVLRRLRHRSIVEVLDTQTYQGSYFIVTRYLDGQSLSEVLRKQERPMELDCVFEIISQVGEALSYAHSQDIVHRDVKPSNILLVESRAVLIDFGVARPITSAEQNTVLVGGTLAYMAPEQAAGRQGDQRTDVYGLTSVLYELLTGRNPGQGTFRKPSEVRTELSSAFDVIVERGREVTPADRYPSVDALLSDVRQAICLDVSSACAPWWLRGLHATDKAIRRAQHSAWMLVLVVALFVASFEVLPTSSPYLAVARVLSVAIGVLVILGAVAQWFVRVEAPRLRGVRLSSVLASYGGVLGLLIGITSSVLWMRAIRIHGEANLMQLGSVGITDFVIFSVVVFTESTVTVGVLLLFIRGGGALARRLGKDYSAGACATALLFIAVLLIAAVVIPPGRFGNVDTTLYSHLLPRFWRIWPI